MSDTDCNCGDLTVDQETEETAATDGWIEARPVETARLPTGVAGTMSRFFGESIDGFEDMIAAIRSVTDGGAIAMADLCHVEGETPHVAETDDETYYFRCFYDGVALAHLVDEPVEIRTETPTNDPITIRVSPTGDVDATPSDAGMSFGVATERDVPAGDSPTADEVYGAICPYVKAFRSRDEYERWAEGVAATTVGVPLEAGVPIAAALTAPSPARGAE